MIQRYKVFVNNKVILITNVQPDFHSNNQWTHINYEQLKNDDGLFKYLTSDSFDKNTILINPNPEEVFKELSQKFTPISAAGGLVENKEKEFLFIFRNGKWDLPKGKIEKGESIEQGAVREVMEECGIEELSISKPIPSTFHIYQQKNTWFLKETHWFLITSKKTQTLKPQLEEGITKVEWIPKKAMEKVFDNTYALINALVKTQLEQID